MDETLFQELFSTDFFNKLNSTINKLIESDNEIIRSKALKFKKEFLLP